MNIEVGNNKYYLHKRYTDFLMLHQVRCPPRTPRSRPGETRLVTVHSLTLG